ncbi:MAG: S9 family peptidase, partial [Acidobacteriota bacterium]
EAKTEEEEKRETEKDDARVVDRDDRHPVLWLADCDSRKVRRLVSPPWRVSEVAWMPDGERLLVVATDHLHPELLTERIFSVRLRDGGMEEVAAPAPPFRDVKVSPDGGSFAYVGVRGDGPVGHDLFVQPLDDDDDDDDEDGEARNLTGGSLDRPVRSYAWGREGLLHVLAQTGFGNTLFTITPEGALKREEKLDVHPTSFAVGPGLLAFAGETTTKPSELWLARSGGKAERMTHLNEERAELSPVAPEILRYKSFDGTEIEAGLLKPPGSGPFPTVVLVHGGPSGRWGDFFDPLGQLLVSGGLAVLYPNVRGSTGYGERFLEMNRHDWGGGDFKDVMAGVDFLIERGVAHRERLGIGGWSYGGYMAAWAVTQTDRFRAAVSGAPMTDLASEYGTEMSSINAYDTWFLGTPYENLSLFIERSPVTHVKNARTPTLILCGEKDTTDPLGQCQQFYRGLKRYRVETELVVYPREGHGIREEKHRIDRLQRFVGWFEKYLK